jgi:predicted O-methyltransferase YrrM
MKLLTDDTIGAAVPPELYDRWTLLRGVDRDKLPKALRMAGDKLVLAHYDSDKSYLGRRWAYRRIWERLQPGGLLISDDIEDNTAFMDFSQALRQPAVVVKKGGGFVGVIRKN